VDKKIKIVQVIADSDLSGGPKHVLGILENINKDEFDVFLICPAGNLLTLARKIPGVEAYQVEMPSKFDVFAPMEMKYAFRKIYSSGNVFSPMIVHSHGPRAGLLARASLPHGVFSVYTEHRWDFDYHLENRVNEYFQLKYLRKYNFKTDLIIAVSSSVKDFLLKKKLAPENRVIVIPNGIELESKKLKVKSKNGDKKFHQITIGSVGNLNKQKGYDYLIEAMAIVVKKYPHITLEIVGDGEEREDLRFKIKDLRLDKNITLLGRRNDVEKLMKHWDIFVSSSIAETFGIVLLEAMKNGLPIVATRVGGVPDIITSLKNGLLVAKEDPESLAEAILKLVDHPSKAAEMVRQGHEIVKKYDWKNVIQLVQDAYRNVVSSKRTDGK